MSLPRLDRIDRFGHCVICTRNLITQRVVDGKVINMFTPDHGHAEFLLNNGSKMQVCMCSICKNTYDLADAASQTEIMDAVQKGWQLEVKALVADESQSQWTEEFGKDHLNTMSKLSIDCHSENVDKNVLLNRSQELGKLFNNKEI